MSSNEPRNETKNETHLVSAYQLGEAGELERALVECRLALQVEPGSAEAHNFLGIILTQLGHQDEAIQAFRTAVKLDPDFADAADNFADAQSEAEFALQSRRNKHSGRSALFGAAIFGGAFGLAGWSLASSSVRQLPDGTITITATNFVWFYLLSGLAIGASIVILEIVNKQSHRLAGCFILGVLGSIFGRMAADVTNALISGFIRHATASWFTIAQRFFTQLVFGAFVGGALGTLLPGRTLLRTLVAGALGFAVAEPIAYLISNLLSSASIVGNPNSFDAQDFVVGSATAQLVRGLVAGACLGWAVGAAEAESVYQKSDPTTTLALAE